MGLSVAKDELYYIYVLRVEENGWYVGSTQSFERRMRSHFGKGGAVATKEAGITYTYKVNNLADWAKKPEVHAAFPVVKSILDGVGSKESKHAIKLTSQGWEAKGLD